jgi:hypothetical protein
MQFHSGRSIAAIAVAACLALGSVGVVQAGAFGDASAFASLTISDVLNVSDVPADTPDVLSISAATSVVPGDPFTHQIGVGSLATADMALFSQAGPGAGDGLLSQYATTSASVPRSGEAIAITQTNGDLSIENTSGTDSFAIGFEILYRLATGVTEDISGSGLHVMTFSAAFVEAELFEASVLLETIRLLDVSFNLSSPGSSTAGRGGALPRTLTLGPLQTLDITMYVDAGAQVVTPIGGAAVALSEPLDGPGTNDVPAPGVLALVAPGLIGLLLTRRRRR